MELHNKMQNREKTAYYSALTLLFSYAELIIPRVLPFLRFGFGNIVILKALDSGAGSFFVLTVFKSVASGFFSGTLFSPFFVISIVQSVLSGLFMFFLNKIKGRWLSIFGISFAGSALSAVIQIFLSSFYLGTGTYVLLGPMLIFSLISGFITAYISQRIDLPENVPHLGIEDESSENCCRSAAFLQFFLCAGIVFCGISIFILKNFSCIAAAFVISVVFQFLCGRKFKILPHLFLWIFVMASGAFQESGKVIFKSGFFTITDGGLYEGFVKSLKLSAVMAVSQISTLIPVKASSFLGMIFSYSSALIESFSAAKGTFKMRIENALKVTSVSAVHKKKGGSKTGVIGIMFLLFLVLFIYDFGGFKIC